MQNILKSLAENKTIKFYIEYLKVNFIPIALILSSWFKLLYFNVEIGTYFRDKTMFAISFATVILFFIVPLVTKKFKNELAIISAFVITMIILGNLAHVRYFGSLITLDAFSIIGVTNDVGTAVLQLVFVTDLLLFLDIFIAIILRKKLRFIYTGYSYKKALGLTLIGLLAILSLSSFIFYRDRVLYVSRFLNSVYDAKIITERYGLFSVYGFDIYKATQKPKDLTEEKKSEILAWTKENLISTSTPNEATGVAKGKNIVMIEFESLENFVINKKVEGQEITPNLNKLVGESVHFNNNYFSLGLGNTSDSDLVSNTSLHPLRDAATFIRYGENDFNGLPEILKKNGYETSSYHAYNKSFWNRGVAHKSLGYENSYFSENYSGKIVEMGTNDGDFFDTSLKLMKEKKDPTFNFLITLSSHYPFYLTDDIEKLTFSSAQPQGLQNYYNSIHYADKALGSFIDNLKKEGMYDDTLIVVFGDHVANKGEIDYGNFAEIFNLSPNAEKAKNDIESKRTPLIFKFPQVENHKTISELSSTIDIMPTILNLAGVKTTRPMFGRDLFSQKKPFFASMFYFDNGVVMDDKHVFRFGSTNNISEGECYLISQENWSLVNNESCREIVNRRNKEQEISSLLIKFDLLRNFPI